MKYTIDVKKKEFAYIQLYEQLKRDIVQGTFTYGDKLPSKRLLAEETGASVITVEHTYSILCDEGYIEPRERSGYFVIYRESDFISVTERAVREGVMSASKVTGGIVDHIAEGHGAPQTGKHSHAKGEFPFSVLAKTMRRVLSEYGEEILIKSPNHGCQELREAITSYLKRSNGIIVKPEQIIIGSGAEYIYSLIVQLLGTQRVFALENPSYHKIRQVYEANGVCCDMLELGSNGIMTSELEKTDASVLHITPFHSFPSGITASVSKRQEYLKWAQKRGGYIIEDNYDSELTVSKKNEDTVFSLAKNDSVIYLNTFSQTIAPAMRIGYMVLPESLVEKFEHKLGFYSCTVPVFEQYVLAELMNSGDFERHINRVRRARRKAK